jgi:hypothetical protein
MSSLVRRCSVDLLSASSSRVAHLNAWVLESDHSSSCEKSGGDLLSQGEIYPQVPSAPPKAVLTSVFGMGTGVTLPL